MPCFDVWESCREPHRACWAAFPSYHTHRAAIASRASRKPVTLVSTMSAPSFVPSAYYVLGHESKNGPF